MEFILRKLIFAEIAIAEVTGNSPRPGIVTGTSKSLKTILDDLTGFSIGLGVSIAVIVIIYAAFLMMFAGGDAEKFGTGKKTIFYAVAGLAVLLFSAAIVEIIRRLVGI